MICLSKREREKLRESPHNPQNVGTIAERRGTGDRRARVWQIKIPTSQLAPKYTGVCVKSNSCATQTTHHLPLDHVQKSHVFNSL